MAEDFFTSPRGCVYTVSTDNAGRGFYSFQPGLPEPGRILLNGGDLDDGDIVSPVCTLAGNKILYTFGSDWGKSSVSGIVLLGESSGGGAPLASLAAWFRNNRVSKKPQPLALSGPGNISWSVFVTRMVLAPPDPEINVQPFAFQILITS